MTAEGRVQSPPITTEQGYTGWSWFCHEDGCGWSGMSCPSEDFARREGERHRERDHAPAPPPSNNYPPVRLSTGDAPRSSPRGDYPSGPDAPSTDGNDHSRTGGAE